MLRIALCDDDPAQRLHMAQMLRKYLCRRPEAAGEVSAFASGQELLDSIEAGGKDYDLYIMDALMPGLTGTDLGVRLRELGGSGAIIYLVSAREHTLEAYKSHALGYLLKPVDQDTLSRKLDYAIGTLQQKLSACVPVKTRGGMCCLSLAGLLYVEMQRRREPDPAHLLPESRGAPSGRRPVLPLRHQPGCKPSPRERAGCGRPETGKRRHCPPSPGYAGRGPAQMVLLLAGGSSG